MEGSLNSIDEKKVLQAIHEQNANSSGTDQNPNLTPKVMEEASRAADRLPEGAPIPQNNLAADQEPNPMFELPPEAIKEAMDTAAKMPEGIRLSEKQLVAIQLEVDERFGKDEFGHSKYRVLGRMPINASMSRLYEAYGDDLNKNGNTTETFAAVKLKNDEVVVCACLAS